MTSLIWILVKDICNGEVLELRHTRMSPCYKTGMFSLNNTESTCCLYCRTYDIPKAWSQPHNCMTCHRKPRLWQPLDRFKSGTTSRRSDFVKFMYQGDWYVACYLSLPFLICWAMSSWGTALHAGRSWVPFPMVSSEFFIFIILPVALRSWCWLGL